MTPTTTLLDLAILLDLLLVTPLLGRWFMRRLRTWTTAGLPQARMSTYGSILVMEWSMTVAFAALWLLIGRSPETMGLSLDFTGWRWLGAGLAVVAVAVLWVQWKTTVANPGKLEGVRTSIGDLADIVPRDDRESRMFAGVSLTAGICEEILYRGMLPVILLPWLGMWGALVVSAAIFGLGHLYQGPAGILKTGTVGLVLGLLTMLSGSIVPAILVHAVIDVTSGSMMRAALEE